MSTTFTEVLPATATSPNNAMNWTPAATPGRGVLTVHTARASCTYAVTEFDTHWGRAFKLAKDGTAGADATSESYDVLVCRDPRGHRCDCKGFSYGHGKPCKHIAAALALIENGWL